MRDVAIIGGGPAGLAVALACARRGLDAVVLEARTFPVDKACGEGLLPPGVAVLEALGVLGRIPAAERAPLRAIRWIGPDGTAAEATLPSGGGMGIRRTALSAALAAAAHEAGAELREGSPARDHRRGPEAVQVELDAGPVEARFLVAADGLASAARAREGLDGPPPRARRLGIRRHFALAPWTDAVEVHFADGYEAYVTPAGEGRVGVAFLFEDAARAPLEALLAGLPALAARLRGAAAASPLAGAGPFERAVRGRCADRFALLGDAAGYVDALTGEGLSLALASAVELARVLPEALARGGARAALAPWERTTRRRFARYAASARLTLAIARRPALRDQVLAAASRHPRAFSRVVGWAVG